MIMYSIYLIQITIFIILLFTLIDVDIMLGGRGEGLTISNLKMGVIYYIVYNTSVTVEYLSKHGSQLPNILLSLLLQLIQADRQTLEQGCKKASIFLTPTVPI